MSEYRFGIVFFISSLLASFFAFFFRVLFLIVSLLVVGSNKCSHATVAYAQWICIQEEKKLVNYTSYLFILYIFSISMCVGHSELIRRCFLSAIVPLTLCIYSRISLVGVLYGPHFCVFRFSLAILQCCPLNTFFWCILVAFFPSTFWFCFLLFRANISCYNSLHCCIFCYIYCKRRKKIIYSLFFICKFTLHYSFFFRFICPCTHNVLSWSFMVEMHLNLCAYLQRVFFCSFSLFNRAINGIRKIHNI